MTEPLSIQRSLLQKALAAGRLPHAYLFAGPEGSGKRQLARELGQALLCEARSFPPCRACGACRRVEAGSHADFHLLLAEGKFVKIESVRELSARLHYHGFEGGTRVGVVPEVERMKPETQNAFLKTLEEPPDGAILILTTHNPGRVLPTIISRCQMLRFGPMSRTALRQTLISERGLDPDRADLVAAISQGNAKKALELDLDFVVGFRKKALERLVSIPGHDVVGLLDFAEQMAKATYPLEDSIDLIAGFYLDALHHKLGVGRLNNVDLADAIKREAEASDLATLIKRLETVHLARRRADGAANPRLGWEILAMTLRDAPGAEINDK